MPKNILAIETATARGSIALLVAGKVAAAPCIGENFEHSDTLIPRIQQLLKSQKLRLNDLDLICVSQGPGSFTGLRVGIAAAKGLSLGLGIPLVAIPTLEILFSGFLSSLAPTGERARVRGSSIPSHITLLLDARKREFFAQVWRKGKPQPPKVVPESEVATFLKSRTHIVSPQLSKVTVILSTAKDLAFTQDTKDRFPDAADLAILGAKKFSRQRRGDSDVRPFYLRKTDAEILFKNKPRSVFRWERGK